MNRNLLFALALSAPCLAASPSDDLELSLTLDGPAWILPEQGIDLDLRLANRGDEAATGLPELAPRYARALRFHVQRAGGEVVDVQKPFRYIALVEGPRAKLTLRPGETARERYHLALDWEDRSWLFEAPGTWQVWVSLALADGTSLESARLSLRVAEPSEAQARELAELRAIEGRAFLHAPHAISFAPDPDGTVGALLAFRERHPTSTWAIDAGWAAAVRLDKRVLVEWRDDADRVAEGRARLRQLLDVYLSEEGTSFAEDARDLLRRRFEER